MTSASGGAGQGPDGVVSIFRGLYRFSRHQSRLHGNHGPGQQVQAATIEHMLLGEALQLALYANRAIIEKGGEALEEQSTLLIVRQATAIYLGSKVAGGTTAGPSISIVALAHPPRRRARPGGRARGNRRRRVQSRSGRSLVARRKCACPMAPRS